MYFLEFCHVDCDYDNEISCPGAWNDDWTEQITSDYCLPNKVGECWNDCPKQCGKEEVICPGPKNSDGCQIMSAYCAPSNSRTRNYRDKSYEMFI